MAKSAAIAAITAIMVFALDQLIKSVFLGGWSWDSEVISLHLVFNRGVAFSMFASLGEWLKYIQIVLIMVMLAFAWHERKFFARNSVAIGMLFGAGWGNIIDRFLHGGVVDYIAWHYGFDFAVFNFADVMINVAVVLIVVMLIWDRGHRSEA
jgi:signal peptidase II